MISYALGYFGQAMLWACFLASIAAAMAFVGSYMLSVKATKAGKKMSGEFLLRSDRVRKGGHVLVIVAAAAIAVCCAVIVEGFFTQNFAIQYVAQYYPEDTGSLFWFYQLSGLWAGRSGSLLTWGLLIALFALWVSRKHRDDDSGLTSIALAVMMGELFLFAAVMIFSSDNNPFVLTDSSLIAEDGSLTGTAVSWGMNVLLQHWAMAIHPPTLFIGYAGMTVPFAYAVASLACNDPSKLWVDFCNRIALFSFAFLSMGIGLGAVWAYVVLGWGGYWGWDPVENASLLSWLAAVAMLHSFTVYRKRDMMKGWALFTATLTFVFVILGTFITRSGLIESVHAFSSDTVSIALFLFIMIIALVRLGLLWAARRKAFITDDDIVSLASKNGSYYFTNIVMVFSGILLAYLTIASGLPSWLPGGGMTVGSGAYETIARPLGIAFCALAAVCPFLSWKKTDGAEFWRNVRVPAVIALVLFVLLAGHCICNLFPIYEANVTQTDTTAAAEISAMGPAWYYNGLAIVGMLVASLLMANSAYLVVRGVRARMRNKGENLPNALVRLFAKSPAQAGGYLTHLGLGIVLVGLIGSSMYVMEREYLFSEEGQTAQIGSYTVEYVGSDYYLDDDKNRCSEVDLVVSRDGAELGRVTVGLEWTAKTGYGQTRVTAETFSTPFEDLFVAHTGYTGDSVYVSVRINPLISLVWVGFGVMVLGIVLATIPRRGSAALRLPADAVSGGASAGGSDGDGAGKGAGAR